VTRESERLKKARGGKAPWRKGGPYLSERQWGTVREDYRDSGGRLELPQPRPGRVTRLSLDGYGPRRGT
jgi:hypothetical protein